jgi:TetR/AcrR family transcriptional regulator, cholesterol catabolism regulator
MATRSSTRRDEILAVARAQIAERGYGPTSMRDIATASGVLAGSLYSHFRSKAELVQIIVTRFYDELIPAQQKAAAQGGTGAAQLRRMIDDVFAVCARHREELTILHYDWHTLSALAELEQVQEQSVETLALWKTTIEQGQADGSLRGDVEVEGLVRIITSSIHALIDTVRYASQPVGSATDEALAEMLQNVVLDGAAARPAPPKRSARTAKATTRRKTSA